MRIESVANEELVVGDMLAIWCGRGRIVEIRPYRGTLSDILFAIAETDAGWGISLERGGQMDVVRSEGSR